MNDNSDTTDKLVKDIISSLSENEINNIVKGTNDKFDLIKNKAQADTKKTQVINHINAKTDKVIKEIDSLVGVIEEEKTTFKDEITAKKEEAVNSIEGVEFKDLDNGTDVTKNLDTINSTKSKYFDDVDKILGNAKDKSDDFVESANKAIQDKLSELLDSLDKEKERELTDGTTTVGLSEELINDYKDKLNEKVQEVLENIANSKNTTDIINEKNNGITELEKLYTEAKNLSDNHIDDKEEVLKKANDVKAELENNANLSDKEKEGVYTSIENTNSQDASTEAKEAGINELEKIRQNAELAGVKNKSKEDIDNKATQAEKEVEDIFNNGGITEAQKDAYIEKIRELQDTTKDNIDSKTTVEEVNSEKENGVNEIDKIVADAKLQVKKNSAESEFEKTTESASTTISQFEGLTEEDKQGYSDKLNEILENTKNDIEIATTEDEINEALKKGNESIEQLVAESKDTAAGKMDTLRKNTAEDIQSKADKAKELQEAKDKAKEELKKYVEAKKDTINKLTGLSDKEKEDYISQIDKIVEETNERIENSQSKEAVNDELNNGKSKINNIVVNAEAKSDENSKNAEIAKIEKKKQEAINDIQDSADKAKDIIDNLEHITSDEKNNYKDTIQDKVDNANEELTKKDSDINTTEKIDDLKKKTQEEIDDIVDEVTKIDKERIIKNVTDVANNVHNADISNVSDELYENVFTPEEQKKIDDGEVAKVYLVVNDAKDTISEQDKALMEQVKATAKFDMYLDISMFKQVGNSEPQKISNTNGSIKIMFKLNDEVINTDKNIERTYNIIRVHNGVVDILDSEFNETTKSLSFETDRFSSYAIVYTDKVLNDNTKDDINNSDDNKKDDINKGDDKNKENNDQNNVKNDNNNNVVNNNDKTTNNEPTTSDNNSSPITTPTTSKDNAKTPTTNDRNNIIGWITLLMISLAAGVGVFLKRKKKQD